MADLDPKLTRVAHVLEDPRAEAIAQTYAEAFLNAAGKDAAGQLEEFASFIDAVFTAQPEFARMLTSGMVHRDDKLAMIERVLAPRGTPMFTNFVRVLAKHDRLELLPTILQTAKKSHELRSGQERVQIKSARPLTDAQQQNLQQQLAAALPFKPILEMQIDPTLLGGLIIRVGDTVYDGSLRTRLKQLRGRLRARSLHEIQSGRNRFSHPEGN